MGCAEGDLGEWGGGVLKPPVGPEALSPCPHPCPTHL